MKKNSYHFALKMMGKKAQDNIFAALQREEGRKVLVNFIDSLKENVEDTNENT